MQDIDQFRKTFFQECDEQLASMEVLLSKLEEDCDRVESLNAAFRAIHSIKGGAAMFGFRRLISFAHAFESALDTIRGGTIAIGGDLVEKLLLARDVLADLSEADRMGVGLPEGYELAALQDLTLACGPIKPSHIGLVEAPGVPASDGSALVRSYQITFEPDPNILRRGTEPLALVRNLSALGLLSVDADTSALPCLADVDPAAIYLKWNFRLDTHSDVKEIRNAFAFVAEGSRLEISCLDAPSGSGTEASAASDVQIPVAPAHPQRPRRDRRISSIRVDLDRVERLVDLIGEITIAQAMVLQHLDPSAVDANPLLYRSLNQLQQLTRGLQDGVMAIRAQPIRSVFARMPSVAREVAQVTGRRVRLEMDGEETEIDKTIIEQLSDPLIHIIRNAIDHGIEAAEERRNSGKPDTGLVRLSAAQRGGRIVIEVSDDGRGIDRTAVFNRAVAHKLVSADAVLTEEEVDKLIFMPGLSTATAVSGISGRGVGMDVVQKNIHALGGRVSVRSQNGFGTTTTITLPLTLAVLDGMLVRAGTESYLIPLNNVAECIVVAPKSLVSVPGAGEIIAIRGRHVRTIHLARQLGIPHRKASELLQVIVVETENGGAVGVIVDEILGSQQIVIKSIRGACGELKGIAGATILGNGNIALILDVNQLTALDRDCKLPSRLANLGANSPETHAA